MTAIGILQKKEGGTHGARSYFVKYTIFFIFSYFSWILDFRITSNVERRDNFEIWHAKSQAI
jgi:hypothetical protein